MKPSSDASTEEPVKSSYQRDKVDALEYKHKREVSFNCWTLVPDFYEHSEIWVSSTFVLNSGCKRKRALEEVDALADKYLIRGGLSREM